MSNTKKFFLDTSIFRPLLLGTKKYKHYLNTQLADSGSLYISPYILMELNRSYLCNIINFYFVLLFPDIKTVAEAMTFWANKYKTSELKAILQLIPQICKNHSVDISQEEDKDKAILLLGVYIRRFEVKSRSKFKDTGRDLTKCSRGALRLSREEIENIAKGFKDFIDRFCDKVGCKNSCNIQKILLVRFVNEIKSFVEEADKIKGNSGFQKIATQLKEILEGEGNACSCDRCARIGDAVISLIAPREHILAHTDESFDGLCTMIAQPHVRLASEVATMKSGS